MPAFATRPESGNKAVVPSGLQKLYSRLASDVHDHLPQELSCYRPTLADQFLEAMCGELCSRSIRNQIIERCDEGGFVFSGQFFQLLRILLRGSERRLGPRIRLSTRTAVALLHG
jgi:hypothetical protein